MLRHSRHAFLSSRRLQDQSLHRISRSDYVRASIQKARRHINATVVLASCKLSISQSIHSRGVKMINPFLRTLFQNLFAAEQRMVELKKARDEPIASIGGEAEVYGILKDAKIESDVMRRVVDEVKQIVKRGDDEQFRLRQFKLDIASSTITDREIVLETYLDTHY